MTYFGQEGAPEPKAPLLGVNNSLYIVVLHPQNNGYLFYNDVQNVFFKLTNMAIVLFILD